MSLVWEDVRVTPHIPCASSGRSSSGARAWEVVKPQGICGVRRCFTRHFLPHSDPYQVGAQFCQQYGLGQDQVGDIVQFIATAQGAPGGGAPPAPAPAQATATPEMKAAMVQQVMAMGFDEGLLGRWCRDGPPPGSCGREAKPPLTGRLPPHSHGEGRVGELGLERGRGGAGGAVRLRKESAGDAVGKAVDDAKRGARRILHSTWRREQCGRDRALV